MRAIAAAFGLGLSAAPALAAKPAEPLIYVALLYSDAVSIYQGQDARTPSGQITQGIHGPVGLATDAAGTLYVSNNNNTVTAYAARTTTPSATYTNGIDSPGYLATGPDGSLYVNCYGNSTIVQYPANSQTPSRTIHFQTTPQGIAVDSRGNLYVVVGTDIERFPPRGTVGAFLGFSLQFTPTALGFDRTGDLAVNQLDQGLSIFTRRAPHTQIGSFGFPAGPPAGFSFGGDGKSLYATDSSFYRVVRVTYPQYNFANVIDGVNVASGAIAVYPPLYP